MIKSAGKRGGEPPFYQSWVKDDLSLKCDVWRSSGSNSSALPLQGARVWSLVRELRSRKAKKREMFEQRLEGEEGATRLSAGQGSKNGMCNSPRGKGMTGKFGDQYEWHPGHPRGLGRVELREVMGRSSSLFAFCLQQNCSHCRILSRWVIRLTSI